ncbi:MAG: adenosylmethionine--8-amino-7-oxononanoate transaminase [Arcobacter butzleri]|jgi:adenosylmethionine-8-amino-7-oxononanoate aminotransferase|nr:adenosylmethionine--8-amino-7-oxononanoate transaminase [Arcobacteraceae bacterium]MDY0365746.1 adenosylmethionine--8-amino-7-oxononanoate transaminase [Arcobacteraceae bacterium]NLO17542.1 adenosylmethionine--8-amino-7-oxononanoate transaminase [Aliarcobacter butzleri]
MTNKMLEEEDLKYIWHPCTQMKDHEQIPLIPIKRAKGIYLEDYDNNIFIDGISSWWVNNLGHCNPYISKKITKQLKSLEHVIFAGFTHKSAISLSKKLVEITPKGLNKVFYADNGSSGIEVALKLSFHYFKNKGKTKSKFLSLSGSYHGETLGALAVSDTGMYKEVYSDILLQTIQTPKPKDQSKQSALKAIDKLELILEQEHKNICAFIVEPLVQCAGGMHMYHPIYLKKAKELCKRYNIFFIADEIAVGFGRTGYFFASQSADITPDIMLLSKGLTGGFLPLCAVMISDEIYNAFYCDYQENKNFLHSHSYTANPLCCTAAIATIEYLEKYNILEKNRSKIKQISKELKRFDSLSIVKEIRQTGMIAAIELKDDLPYERVGLKINQYCLKQGLFIRPLGNVIYFMPPFIIKKYEIKKSFEIIYSSLEALKNNTI